MPARRRKNPPCLAVPPPSTRPDPTRPQPLPRSRPASGALVIAASWVFGLAAYLLVVNWNLVPAGNATLNLLRIHGVANIAAERRRLNGSDRRILKRMGLASTTRTA